MSSEIWLKQPSPDEEQPWIGTPVEEATRAWFDGYSSDIGYEVHDLHVTVDGTVGFCSYLYHVSGTLKAGGEVDSSTGGGSLSTTTSPSPSMPLPGAR